MKVVFINNLQFLPQSEREQLALLFEPNWLEQRLTTIKQKLLKLNIPFLDGDQLLADVDLNSIPFAKSNDLYQNPLSQEDINRSRYFYKLYQILGQANKLQWRESSFIDWQEQEDSIYKTAVSLAQKEQISDDLLKQYIEDSLSTLDLETRKDEWVLVLDKYAILHPNFFNKLRFFSKFKITPEIVCLSEPSHENFLRQSLLQLQQESKHEARSDLDELYNHTQRYLGKNNQLGDIANIVFSPDYYPEYDYKRAYARYNKLLDSYFFVKRYDSSFATSAFLIRVSTMQKLGKIPTLARLANDIFTLAYGNTTPDIAFIRSSWATAPNLPVNLLKLPENPWHRFMQKWARGLGCYIRQLRLTASLDSDDLKNLK